jgi:formate hydrogenlyase subunit 4
MTSATIVSGAVQAAGGLALAPLLPGLVQHWKARLQGRRGPTPLQPFRELRRLWGKSVVDVEGTTAVYRLAPSVTAASLAAAVLLVPVARQAPNWGVGHDLLALAGLLALARFAVAAASWDVANGFSLMGASRDLTIAVFVEATMILSLTVAALVAGTTDLRGIVAGTAGTAVWETPALALGAAAFALVIVAETGRQPVDNPDTHLELTMLHEGMLLEHSGPGLACIALATHVKQLVVLTLVAALFLPLGLARTAAPAALTLAVAAFAAKIVALATFLAVVESSYAKLRFFRVPQFLGLGLVCAFLALALRVL